MNYKKRSRIILKKKKIIHPAKNINTAIWAATKNVIAWRKRQASWLRRQQYIIQVIDG